MSHRRWFISALTEITFWRDESTLAGNGLGVDYDYRPPAVPNIGEENRAKATNKPPEPRLPIFSLLDSIDFSDHFLIIGDVGTGKSTVTPVREFELSKGRREIVIREPSRAACNALYYSLQALHPELEHELAGDLTGMFSILDRYLYSQPRDESWLVFLPTRRMVEKYADLYRGVYIHGGLEGSEVNRIQRRAETDKNLRIFATNVIASSVNIYVDNVLIFDDVIDSKDKLGVKTLHYTSIDNNSLLQMIGRIGRFKPGRAVILTDSPIPKKIDPISVRKALETETPFDLVLLMSKYGLKLLELEFMSKVDHREVAFAENWLVEIGAIDRKTRRATWKGLLMSEIPYEPDFAHMIASALISQDYEIARFLIAIGP